MVYSFFFAFGLCQIYYFVLYIAFGRGRVIFKKISELSSIFLKSISERLSIF